MEKQRAVNPLIPVRIWVFEPRLKGKRMCDSQKLRFYQSYGNCDIWFSQDTKSGVTKWMFWFMGKTYEAESHDEIINLAKECVNNMMKRSK